MSYGCHNRAELRGHCTRFTDWHEGQPLLVRIDHPHVMAKDCQYTLTALGQADTGCTSCKHRLQKGTE